MTRKNIPLCISTRGIGFAVVSLFQDLKMFPTAPDTGDIYAIYRVYLAALEYRLCVNRHKNFTNFDDDYISYDSINLNSPIKYFGLTYVHHALKSIIESCGIVEANGKTYVPKIPKPMRYADGTIIVDPTNVTYSNLRNVVEILADATSPLDARLRFYKNNPIPGCIWAGKPENPVLQNPDDIIPRDHDLEGDIECMHAKLGYIKTKCPENFSKGMDYRCDGSKCMLACNKMGNLRILDREANDDLTDYYRKIRRQGVTEELSSLVKLTDEEINFSATILLGEHPSTMEAMYPAFVTRDFRCTEQTIPLSISTRGIGFAVVSLFQDLQMFPKAPDTGDIYAFYRVYLAALECRLYVNRHNNFTYIDDEYVSRYDSTNWDSPIKYLKCVPHALKRIIESCGIIKANGKTYVPRIPKPMHYSDGTVIVDPSNVTYSNLRNVVKILANASSPLDARLRFYKNNPIPGCIWAGKPENPVLQNPDDIIPLDHDLEADIKCMHGKLTYIYMRRPKYCDVKIDYECKGSKSMLACNKMGDLRVSDREADDDLQDYYRKIKLEGNTEKHHESLVKLTKGEEIDSAVALLGEHPSTMDDGRCTRHLSLEIFEIVERYLLITLNVPMNSLAIACGNPVYANYSE